MTTVTVQEAKDHLRLLEDDEDTYIATLLEAAEGHVAGYLGEDLPEPMPAPVRAAVLLLVGDLFENRERQADRALYENATFHLLLNPYRSAEVL